MVPVQMVELFGIDTERILITVASVWHPEAKQFTRGVSHMILCLEKMDPHRVQITERFSKWLPAHGWMSIAETN